MPIEIRSCGSASITSPARESSVSTAAAEEAGGQPDDEPDQRPRCTEATTPTISDVRAPYIVRTKRSRPSPSAPNQNCEFGPFGTPNSSSIVSLVGSCVFGWPVTHGGDRAADDRDQDQQDDHDRARTSAALSSRKRSQKSRDALRLAMAAALPRGSDPVAAVIAVEVARCATVTLGLAVSDSRSVQVVSTQVARRV